MEDYANQLEEILTGLEDREAKWMPGPQSNHIIWILWHMGRMEDNWGWYLRGGGNTAWIEGGWAERLGIDPSRNGTGDSIEQVTNFPDVPVQEVISYWKAARDLLVPSVEATTYDRLTETRPEVWRHAPDEAPDLLFVLGRIPVENGQHVGQIAYIRGLYSSK